MGDLVPVLYASRAGEQDLTHTCIHREAYEKPKAAEKKRCVVCRERGITKTLKDSPASIFSVDKNRSRFCTRIKKGPFRVRRRRRRLDITKLSRRERARKTPKPRYNTGCKSRPRRLGIMSQRACAIKSRAKSIARPVARGWWGCFVCAGRRGGGSGTNQMFVLRVKVTCVFVLCSFTNSEISMRLDDGGEQIQTNCLSSS
jgi:hypothetical protein